MKKKRVWDYLLESLTGFCSLALAILFFFALYKIKDFYKVVQGIIVILMPLIYGLVISFILSPICEYFTELLEKNIPEEKIKPEKKAKLVNTLSVLLSVLTLILIVYILFAMIVPQLLESITTIISNMDNISNSIVTWGNNLFQSRPELQHQFQNLSSQISTVLGEWVRNTFAPKIEDMISSLSEGLVSALNLVKNVVIGLIISVYVLSNRELYSAQAKKLLYGMVSPKWANRTMSLVRETKTVFSGFVLGKLLDSFIIGILCFVGMLVMKMPYAMLISTVVGVTNIIPYFGPFFGAIPSAILILTVSPLQALYFIIFILILQQVDGNIIGPKILGSSTGLASFWVLFSLLLFGGLWGVVGMIVGVPLFAIIYDLIANGIRYRLQAKGMSPDTEDYGDLDHIDPETGDFIMKDGSRRGSSWQKQLEEEVENMVETE